MAGGPATGGLRRNANWRRLWAGQAVSLVGDFVFHTTVVLWIGTQIAGGRSWAPSAVAGALIAIAVPILLVGPVAGVFVDRWDHRRTMLVADLVRAGLSGALLVLPLAGTRWPVGVQLTVVYAVLVLTSATSQFFNPARFVVIASVVPEADRARAFGVASATASTAAVLGPPLAAPLLFAAGVHWALVVNATSYLLSLVAVWLVRVPAAPPPDPGRQAGFRREFADGLRFFAGNRSLRVIAGAVCLYMFGVGAIHVLDVFFVTENLGADAGWLGTLTAALGIGSIVGALVAGRVTERFGAVRVFAGGLALTGLAVLAYSRCTSLPVAVAVLALTGIPLSAVNVVVSPLVLRATPRQLLGRVNAVLNPLVYLASVLSMAVAGFLASTVLRDLDRTVAGLSFGPIDTVFAAAGTLMVLAGLLAYRPLVRAVAADPPAGSGLTPGSPRPPQAPPPSPGPVDAPVAQGAHR
ncbi:MAG TPA: MFS transporter [Pilimelia sp.]|nr:MFS transporter [Pilimelia sp.]